MKKIYTTPKMSAVSGLKNSCSPYGFSFIKTLSLVSMAVFLSNASPVAACDLWGNVSTYFGGGANIRKSIAPIYVIDGNLYRDVGSAFSGVDRKFKGLESDLKLEIKNAFDTAFIGWDTWKQQIDKQFQKVLSDMLVKQDAGGTITIGANKDGYVIDIANNSRKARVLTGVHDAVLDPTSNQAVNGSQLYKLGIGVAKSFGGGAGYDKNGNWIAPTFMVKAFDKNGNKVDKSYNSVSAAFTGVSDSFVSLDKKIENLVANVAGDSLVKQDDTGLITIGGKVSGAKVSIANSDNAVRTLTGVNAGSITATSTEAVNGSQLYSMNNVVAGYFGGGAEYKDGKWSAPTFTVKVFSEDGHGAETHYENVADALIGVNTSFTNLDKKIENVVTNVAGNSLVKQDDTGLITIGGKVSGAKVSIANSDNAVRTLTGVNAGSITALSTDAINGSQLYSMSNLVANYFSRDAGYDEDGKWNAPTFTVKVFNEDGNGTETHYENVADALSGVSSSFTNLNQKIENVTSDSFIKQNSAGLITIGRNKAGNRIDITNDVNAPRVLSGVKGGAFTKTSTEAVNGSQLYLLSQAFASYFGGGAGYNDEGRWSAPTFFIKAFDKDGNETEHKYTNVADAFAGINDVFKDLNQQIIDVRDGIDITEKSKLSQKNGDADDIISEGFPFMSMAPMMRMRMLPVALDEVQDEVEVEDSGDTLAIGSKSPSKKVSILNSKGETRTLVDVAAGKLSADSTEAINGSQLYSLSTAVATSLGGEAGYNEKGEWKAPSFVVNQFKDGHLSEESYNNVASAFAGMNETLSIIDSRLSKVEKDGNSNGSSNGFPWNEEEGAYDVSHNGKDSKITHVADGDVSEGSKEVVNGGQLWNIDNKVKDVADKVTEVEKKVDVAVSYDVKDGEKTGSITLVGENDGEPVLIKNVADGDISKDSKQAVNGGQLHEQMDIVLKNAEKYTDEKVGNLINDSVNQAKSYTDMKFEALTYDISNVRKEARQAAAIGLAVSNLRYFDDPGSLSVSFGGGLWRGQSAFAIGAGYTSEDGKIRSNLSATSAGGHWGVGGGITLKLK
ncbi:YadA-like family protein [Bartonella krasnovii]|uniref:YadA-like family protein n=1 Tax=Bartonella krasnovii TaxID=2267275 RepID=UPI001F4CFBE5|nr:YadA-like family protein [Bartonella krasnovii]UNF47150.1 YadA-like family protein [Bartonella krasnovii]UNF55514.1 YadA-like family protein [Bartonella krasnovii]